MMIRHLILSFLFISLLTFGYAQNDVPENAQQEKKESPLKMSDTSLEGPSIINSVIGIGNTDTSIDNTNINAAKRAQQLREQGRQQDLESTVRQQQRDPRLEKERNRVNTASPTGGAAVRGKQRNPENLTDAEKIMSEEFVHQGKVNRVLQEECGGKNSDICDGREDTDPDSFLGLDPSMVGMMAKAYTMIVGFTGSSFKKAPSKEETPEEGAEQATESGEEANAQASSEGAEDSSVSDYCRYIPMAVEGMAILKQTMAQDQLQSMPSSSGMAQRDSLLKASKSHKERAKQARIQHIGWASTAACYAGYGTFGGITTDTSYWLKLGGSILFERFYDSEVDRHDDAAKKVKKIADKLPSKGDCNPITDRLCYCTEEATQNDPDFCLPEMRDRYIDKMAEFNTPCIDNRGKPDPACKCRDQDKCFDKKLQDSLTGIGFASGDFMGIRPVQGLSRGSVSSADLQRAQRTNSALNNQLRRELSKELTKAANAKKLSPKQLADAKKLTQKGVPAPLSKILSGAPMSPAAQKKMAEMQQQGLNGSQASRSNVSAYQPSGSSLRRSGGQGLDQRPREDEPRRNELSDLMKKFKGEGRETASGGNVLRFAERAQKQAQISKRNDTFLFDIISNRYQKTAWRTFELDEQSEALSE